MPDNSHLAMPAWQVILLFLLTVLATFILVKLRLANSALKRLFVLASILLVASCVLLAAIDPDLLMVIGAKLNLMDWLSAFCLLPAAAIALYAGIRLHRLGRPSPITMVLAAGFGWACWRELHYGGDLFGGHKLWFTNNMFHLGAFTGLPYFERFRQQMHLPYDAITLYAVHLCFTALSGIVLALLAWYTIRNRPCVVRELRSFLRTLHGRLLLIGAGLYIAAELLGGLLHRMPHWGPFRNWTEIENNFWHTAVEESMECWGAITCLLCAIALWQMVRSVSAPNAAPLKTQATSGVGK